MDRARNSGNQACLEVLSHPVIDAKLAVLRDRNTLPRDFRRTLGETAALMSAAVFRHIKVVDTKTQTPMETMTASRIAQPAPCIVSILRAGNGLANALSDILPEAAVGHVGVQRDARTHAPSFYYEKLPSELDKRQIIITDPMLATGGSAIMVADRLKLHGARDILLCCLVAAPEGVKAFSDRHADIPIIAAALDRELDENCYILPGLGDAGDRFYDTL